MAEMYCSAFSARSPSAWRAWIENLKKTELEAYIRDNGFIEHADVKGDLYSTPCAYVEKLIRDGNDVIILNIENDGAAQAMTTHPDAVSVFILQHSARELLCCLVNRKSETPEQIVRLILKSTEQTKTACNYDYVVLNDDLDTSVQDVVHIICAVRCRTMLHIKLIDQVNATLA